MTSVEDVKRVYAEGLAAKVCAANPYAGRIIFAAVWLGGYRRMLDDKYRREHPARTAHPF